MEILVGESVFLSIWRGNGIPHLFFSNTPACQQFLDRSSAQHEIRCFFIDHCSAVSNNFFFNGLCGISKIALPRYSRVLYKKLNGWKFGHWLTANFTFPSVTWRNIVWSFSMPLWCNRHLQGQRVSIIIALEFFGVFVSTRNPNVFWGEGELCLFSK